MFGLSKTVQTVPLLHVLPFLPATAEPWPVALYLPISHCMRQRCRGEGGTRGSSRGSTLLHCTWKGINKRNLTNLKTSV